MAWVAVNNRGESELVVDDRELRFEEMSASQFLVMPVWIGRKDMLLIGEYAAWQQIDFSAPQPGRRNLYTFVPLLGWLRQAGEHTQLAAFVAPEYSTGDDISGYSFSEWSGYAGVIGISWTSERFAWMYGGVAAFSHDTNMLFPYVGCLWQPTPHWSVSAILPWPSVSYALDHDTMFQVGISPADGTLAAAGDDLRMSYTSWSLLFSGHRRVHKNFWLSAYVGWAGAGNFAISTHAQPETDYKFQRDMVFSLQFSFRPPTSGPTSVPAAIR